MAQCASCGGSLIVTSRDWKNPRKFAYGCSYNHFRGQAVCANNLETPMEETNREILNTLERDLLRPEVVDAAIRKALDRLRPSEGALEARGQVLKAELSRVDEELARLTAAIASGGDLSSLLAAVKDREQRRDHVRHELAVLEGLRRIGRLDLRRMDRDLRGRLTDWQGLLQRQPVQARQILGKLLVGRLIFTPKVDVTGRHYEFVGRESLGKLLADVVLPKGVVTPAGFYRWCLWTLKGFRRRHSGCRTPRRQNSRTGSTCTRRMSTTPNGLSWRRLGDLARHFAG